MMWSFPGAASGRSKSRARAPIRRTKAFVEQKNGAVVRRLVGYGRFEGIDTARVLARLYAASRLHTNFFQPSFKLKDKRREGAKVIKRYHAPATPYARALVHPKLSEAVKQRLRELYRTLDPVVLLAEMRDAQTELGTRVDCRAGKIASAPCAPPPAPDAAAFAKGLGKAVLAGARLNAAAMDAMADPAVRRRLADLGLEFPPRDQQTPEALGALQN